MAYKAKANEQAIQIEGLSELFRALKAVGTPVEAIKDANAQAGELVARSARNTANFTRSGRSTGKLRNTIRVAKVSTNVKIRAGNAKTPYANPIHWGWFMDKKTGFKRNILPNPFMSKALGYTRDEILDSYTKNLQKLIDKHKAPSSKG
jgi:hypothetical protein